MFRSKLLISLLLIISQVVTAQQTNTNNPLAKKDIQWIQKVLDNWHFLCRE